MYKLIRARNLIKVNTSLDYRMEPLNTNNSQHLKNYQEITTKNDNSERIKICNQRLEGTDNKYYKDGANYWSSIDPSVNGMLGGFGNISNIDIEGSAKFLKGVFKVSILSLI